MDDPVKPIESADRATDSPAVHDGRCRQAPGQPAGATIAVPTTTVRPFSSTMVRSTSTVRFVLVDVGHRSGHLGPGLDDQGAPEDGVDRA